MKMTVTLNKDEVKKVLLAALKERGLNYNPDQVAMQFLGRERSNPDIVDLDVRQIELTIP